MKILITYRHFPVAMGRYFHWALQDLGHDTFSVGPYSAGYIPWGNYYFPDFKMPPDLNTEDKEIPLEGIIKKIDYKPDIIIQAGDTYYLTGKSAIPNLIIATDPHALDYTKRREDATRLFNTQKYYSQPEDVYLPYAYFPEIHKPVSLPVKYDVVLCGLQYDHRVKTVEAMRQRGLKVFNALGVIYDDYAKAYARGKIAFVYSSKKDLPARFWEGLSMGKMVLANRVPDMAEFDFKDGEDYVGFDTMEEAVEKATYYARKDTEREKIAQNGLKKVKPHTYHERVRRILASL